jgi:hypothetical protein
MRDVTKKKLVEEVLSILARSVEKASHARLYRHG